jgi:superfamily II DNA or RNA helicase
MQDRVCKLCRRSIPFDLIHGDHIFPWILGGKTDFTNLQALCGSCNLRKGSRPQEVIEQRFQAEKIAPGKGILRDWQIDALSSVLMAIKHEPVLVEACPGAGKTHFGLEVAYRMVIAGDISRVLIIVPTVAIADGWRKAASAASSLSPTLPLHALRDWKAFNPIGEKWLGAITSYQTLAASAEMFMAHATDPGHRTLVIFDEVHHAGARASWGEAAQVAFASHATAILSLSGTPFRTDRDPIAFVRSSGGSADPHFSYTYGDAIRDQACRPVQFVEARGTTTFRTEDNQVHTATFDQTDLTELGQRRRLRAALEWMGDGSIAHKMLADANAYLLALRADGDLDAAGLVVCADCDHAATIASYFESSILGTRPIFACSRSQDDNDLGPADAIRSFRQSSDPWIVAVNMVSEGVDIPRLRAVVYLTNRMTLLSFRQIVGRVVRTDKKNLNDHGRVYIPADPLLVAMAKEVTEEANLPAPLLLIETDKGVWNIEVTGSESNKVGPETLGSVGEQGAVFDTSGKSGSADLINCARLFIQLHGLKNTDPESLAIAAADSPELRFALMSAGEQTT